MSNKREYLDDIKAIAEDILSDLEIKTQEDFENKDSEVSDRMFEEVDGSSWIIYTNDTFELLTLTDNRDAYLDQGLDLDMSQGFDSIATQVAFWAMYEDLREEISSLVSDLPADSDELEAEENWDNDNIKE